MAAPTQINKLFFRSFVIFLLLLFSGQLLRYQFGTSAITAGDVGMSFILLMWISQILLKRMQFQFDRPTKGIVRFIGICFFSLLVNIPHLQASQIFTSSLYIFRFLAYASLYTIVRSFSESEKLKTIMWLEILGFICISLGFFQLFFYPSLRNLYYLGWDEDLYRLFSVFFDPNFAAAFFVLFNFLLIYLLHIDTRRRILHVVLLCLSILALILTFSRSGMLMFFIGVTMYLFLYKKMRYLLLIVLLVIGVYVIESQSFSKENQNLFRKTSSLARVSSAGTALSIIERNPIFGVGFDAYRYAQIRHGYREEKTQFLNHADAGTDNSLLFVFATTGIVGLFVYLSMWKQLIQASLTSYRKQKERLRSVLYRLGDREKFILVSVIALFVDSIFINSLFYPFLMSWMWIILGFRE